MDAVALGAHVTEGLLCGVTVSRCHGVTVGGLGLAATVLIGCDDDDDIDEAGATTATAAGTEAAQATATAAGTEATGERGRVGGASSPDPPSFSRCRRPGQARARRR